MNKVNPIEAIKNEIEAMGVLVATYAKEFEVTRARAVLDIMKVDERFQGSFDDGEIAIIMGLDRNKVVSIVNRATTKLSRPEGARELKMYVASEVSEHSSDF